MRGGGGARAPGPGVSFSSGGCGDLSRLQRRNQLRARSVRCQIRRFSLKPYLKSGFSHGRFGVPDAFERVISVRFLGAGYRGRSVVVVQEHHVLGSGRLAAERKPGDFRHQRRLSADDPFLPRRSIAALRQNTQSPNDFQQHVADRTYRTRLIRGRRTQPKLYIRGKCYLLQRCSQHTHTR